MTEPTTPTPETPETVPDLDGNAAEHADADPAGNEAAKYRRRLRDTEAERDQLRARLEAISGERLDAYLAGELTVPRDLNATRSVPVPAQIAAAERAGDAATAARLRAEVPGLNVDPNADLEPVSMRNPSDLFTIGGVDRAACFNDDGSLNADFIGQAVAQLRTARPELFHSRPQPVPGVEREPAHGAKSVSWADALR